jgi:hypothetical protein
LNVLSPALMKKKSRKFSSSTEWKIIPKQVRNETVRPTASNNAKLSLKVIKILQFIS